MNIPTAEASPYRNYENPSKRQKLSNNYHPIFNRVENNENGQPLTFINENYLILLCRNKKWQEVYYRCHQFPFECMPVSSGEINGSINIYNDTALGLACRNFNKNGLYNQGVTQYEMLELIKALYMACKIQIRCGQGQLGFTPLMDAVANPNSSLDLMKFLIDADLALGEGPEMSLLRKDMNGLCPLDHLINSVHRSHDSGLLALEAIRYIVRKSSMITKYINGYRSVSPLILLLSHKVRPLSSFEEDDDDDAHLESDRLNRVTECVKILLEGNPELIHIRSLMSKCTPLHTAFRNNYGDHVELIKLLLSQDPEGLQVRERNRFGDLPIHVAVSVGASQETLNCLLQHIISTSSGCDNSRCDEVQAVRQPNPTIWAQTSNGLTPIHISWMRHVDGKISYPLTTSISQATSRLAPRRNNKYLDSLSESAEEINTLIKKLPVNHTVIEREAVAKQVLGTFWDFLVHFLRCLHLNEDCCSNDNGRNSKDNFNMLHAISSLPHNLPGPKLPITFFYIALMIYPNQIRVKDKFGRTALHYASASALINKSESGETDTTALDRSSPQKPVGWDDQESSRYISAPVIEHYEAKTKEKFGRKHTKVDILSKLYPGAALSYDKSMFLPIHLVIESEKKSRELCPGIDDKADTEWSRNVHKVILANPDSLDKRDPKFGCFPFLQAAISPSSSLDTIYHILRMSPSLVDAGIPK